jgi:hypothetical protein
VFRRKERKLLKCWRIKSRCAGFDSERSKQVEVVQISDQPPLPHKKDQPQLLIYDDFSQGTTGWAFPSTWFSLDRTNPAPNGAAAFELSNPGTCSQLRNLFGIDRQRLPCSFRSWVETADREALGLIARQWRLQDPDDKSRRLRS